MNCSFEVRRWPDWLLVNCFDDYQFRYKEKDLQIILCKSLFL